MKLVGRRLPNSKVPNLAELGLSPQGARGGLDLTMREFHAPFLVKVVNPDNVHIGWGVACLGCSILRREPTAECFIYKQDESLYHWPASPILVEVEGAPTPKLEPEVTMADLEEDAPYDND